MDCFCPTCGKFWEGVVHSVCPRDGTPVVVHNPLPPAPEVVFQDAPAVRGDYAVPIVSDALGFVAHPDDVAEHRSRFPNIELVMSEGCARPKFRSLSEKRKYFDAIGWADTKDYR